MKKVPCKTGDEYDAIDHREFYHWRPGVAKAIKTGMNRRGRRDAKKEIRQAASEEVEERKDRANIERQYQQALEDLAPSPDEVVSWNVVDYY